MREPQPASLVFCETKPWYRFSRSWVATQAWDPESLELIAGSFPFFLVVKVVLAAFSHLPHAAGN